MKKLWTIKEIKPGDMIRVYNGVYYHYAIYLGNNLVIQFGKPTLTKEEDVEVEIVDSSELSKYGVIEVREYTLKEKLKLRKPEEIIKIAESKVGEKGYNFTSNNCLDFVNKCVFKK